MNKIIHRFELKLFLSIVFLLTSFGLAGQNIPKPATDTAFNKYSLLVIHSIAGLQKTVTADTNRQMVSLKRKIPSIVLDLRYASVNNFMLQKLYPPLSTTWLRRPAADSLAAIQKQLKIMGLGIKDI